MNECILPIVVESSDDYKMAYYRVIFILLIAVSALSIAFTDCIWTLVTIQLITLIVGNFIAKISAIQRLVVTKNEMAIAVHQYATFLMAAKGVVNRDDRRGILIFISKFERQIEVIADIGVTATVGQEQLQKVSNAIGAKMRIDEDEALSDGIAAAEDILNGLN